MEGENSVVSKMADRRMKYPYTITAKIAQFPFKFYAQNQWVFRYWLLGIATSAPLFWYIQKLACSPENTAKWNEIRRREREGHH